MNYTPALPLTSEHRLARLRTWLQLTLVWFAAHVLALIAPQLARRQLADYAREAQVWLITRAVKRVRPGRAWLQPRHHDFASYREITIQRILGARVRRAFRGRAPLDRARAIYAALAQPERLIAHILRRQARRLNKLRCLPRPLRETDALVALIASPACAIDSS